MGAIRQLLPTVGQDSEIVSAELAEARATCIGCKSKKRVEQITAILDTLKALGDIN